MIKTYYITDVLGNCRVGCPHGESCKVGSIKCKRSKCCLESSDGDITAINDWIICKKDQPEEVEKSCDNCRYLDEDDDCRSDISCDDVLWAGWKPRQEEQLYICDHAGMCVDTKCPHLKKHVHNTMCVFPVCRHGASKCIPYKQKEKNKCPMFKKFDKECDHCTPLGGCSFKYEECAHVKSIREKENKMKEITKEMILEAAKGSREKWLNISVFQGLDYAGGNCALCLLFGYKENGKADCSACPMDCEVVGSFYHLWKEQAHNFIGTFKGIIQGIHKAESIGAVNAAIKIYNQLDEICKRLEKEIEDEKKVRKCDVQGCMGFYLTNISNASNCVKYKNINECVHIKNRDKDKS